MKILIVDDSEEDCILIRKILQKSFDESEVTFSHTLNDAIKLVSHPNFDLILLDYYLPDGDGLEFLKSLDTLPYTIPVIMLTGCKDNDLSKKVIQAGAQDYLVKSSMDGTTLTKSIEYSLERIFNLKALEEARQQTIEALRVKEDFMSIMTHELLTPLTGIINGVQLLRDDIEDGNKDRSKELCNVIEESGNSLHTTINNILDYTALDGSEIALYKDKIETSALISFIRGRFEQSIVDKGLKFTLKVAKNVPEIFVSDLKRVKQILFNLISNAIKFTQYGEIIINVSEKDKYLVISIADTGVGIEEEFSEKLFSVFSQEDCSFTRSNEGTGLGLSLVDKITHLLGGKITVQSLKGLGSTFTVFLPLTQQFSSDSRR